MRVFAAQYGFVKGNVDAIFSNLGVAFNGANTLATSLSDLDSGKRRLYSLPFERRSNRSYTPLL